MMSVAAQDIKLDFTSSLQQVDRTALKYDRGNYYSCSIQPSVGLSNKFGAETVL
jgi:hypothetical protein